MLGIGREQKNQKNISFRKMRCLGSRGHFRQQIPESPLFQLQNGASTTSLLPFIMENIDNNSVLLFYFSSYSSIGLIFCCFVLYGNP